ncbi:MAG TPA: hypothetical protein DCZ92_13745 [Elusimicrobia bacterium]|nr:hypothetical protein [Elusimicrobiota bacterium]
MFMKEEENQIFRRLAVSSLERCLARLSKTSAGAWEVTGSVVFRGTLPDAVGQHDFKNNSAAAVYSKVKGAFPVTSMMLFDPEDAGHLSKCFFENSFSRDARPEITGEVVLLELGNIVLNSLVNAVLSFAKKSSIPSMPRYVEGAPQQVIDAVGKVVGLNRNFRIFKATLLTSRNGRAGKSEVFALIPGKLAAVVGKVTLLDE